jgi:hypothetical protein
MGSTFVVAGVFSAGYITWMLQSGALFASMLASIPTWVMFDSLPIFDKYIGTPDAKGDRPGSGKEEDKLEEKIKSLLE